MKYLFIAMLYFGSGFVFANFSLVASAILGLFLLLLSIAIVLNLYDDQLDLIPFDD